jgi:hypothetical protein
LVAFRLYIKFLETGVFEQDIFLAQMSGLNGLRLTDLLSLLHKINKILKLDAGSIYFDERRNV